MYHHTRFRPLCAPIPSIWPVLLSPQVAWGLASLLGAAEFWLGHPACVSCPRRGCPGVTPWGLSCYWLSGSTSLNSPGPGVSGSPLLPHPSMPPCPAWPTQNPAPSCILLVLLATERAFWGHHDVRPQGWPEVDTEARPSYPARASTGPALLGLSFWFTPSPPAVSHLCLRAQRGHA